MSGPSRSQRVAVIEFPGSNCQEETRRALEVAGSAADVLRWNASPTALAEYAGYVLPGGFSYQDRVRAGALAAKDRVMEVVVRAAEAGKLVLGICNGCQILIEAGLVPGTTPGRVEMALAPNVRPGGPGYDCRWVYVRHASRPGRCALTRILGEGEVLPLPIAHAEGRFTTTDDELGGALRDDGRVVFRYCDPAGRVSADPEVNPNGSMDGIAGLCNPDGNVLAMMPHPERAAWLRQVPDSIPSPWAVRKTEAWGQWAAMEGEGPGRRLFAAFTEGKA
jgi:phosphoribosylformylglycinamidine synthase I